MKDLRSLIQAVGKTVDQEVLTESEVHLGTQRANAKKVVKALEPHLGKLEQYGPDDKYGQHFKTDKHEVRVMHSFEKYNKHGGNDSPVRTHVEITARLTRPFGDDMQNYSKNSHYADRVVGNGVAYHPHEAAQQAVENFKQRHEDHLKDSKAHLQHRLNHISELERAHLK